MRKSKANDTSKKQSRRIDIFRETKARRPDNLISLE